MLDTQAFDILMSVKYNGQWVFRHIIIKWLADSPNSRAARYICSFSELLNPEQQTTTGNHVKRHRDVKVPNLIKSLSRSSCGWWGDTLEVLTEVPYLAPSSLIVTEQRLLGLSYVDISFIARSRFPLLFSKHIPRSVNLFRSRCFLQL